MEQALLFFDFSKNIEQDVYHNGEQNSSKKAEKELQDFKDNKINLLTNKEAIVYTGGSLVKNTIKSILHIS